MPRPSITSPHRNRVVSGVVTRTSIAVAAISARKSRRARVIPERSSLPHPAEAGQPVEFIARRVPGEAESDLILIPQVGHNSLFAGPLVDRFPSHGHFS